MPNSLFGLGLASPGRSADGQRDFQFGRHTAGWPRLDILATLVEAYEARHYPIDSPDPIAAIEFMMEQKGLDRRDLEPAIGGRGRVSEILTRKRPLTLPMIRALVPLLSLPAEVLIQPYRTAAAA